MRSADAIWSRWTAFAHRVGSAQARILLGLLYFTILLPFAAILAMTSNPFRASGWHEHVAPETPEPDAARRQF